jgi:signal transduction histidine kinase
MSRPLSLLLVEDSEEDAELVIMELRRQGFLPAVVRVQSAGDLERELGRTGWHLVISDHNLPGFSSVDALDLVKRTAPELPFIVVSGSIGEEYAVEAMRAGASDFIVKTKLHRLAPAVERELREAEDLAERRRIAAALAESNVQLRQAQKLEAIGRLAGGVAHDFNNLLTAILGYADLALAALPSGDPHRDDIEEIKLAGTRAVDLTRQLLAFSRRQVLHRRRLDLGQVVEDVVRLLQRVIGEDITIRRSSSPDLWSVLADQTQIEQIIMNLGVNARDALGHGRTLRLETFNERVDGAGGTHRPSRPGEYVVLRVSDTGEGIPEEIRSRIFEPFFTTKEPGRGTGLGLSTVYGIVNQSEGFIFLDSVIERGTTFSVYLPRTEDAAVAAAPAVVVPEVRPTGHEAILLVEDESSVRELTARVLTQAGYQVYAVAGPQAALRAIEQLGTRIDLLVTDVVMPEMSGPVLAGRVRQIQPAVGVLFISGFSGESFTAIEPYGPDSLLAKPFTPATLTARVRTVLAARS